VLYALTITFSFTDTLILFYEQYVQMAKFLIMHFPPDFYISSYGHIFYSLGVDEINHA
jgi:hypothetical protein